MSGAQGWNLEVETQAETVEESLATHWLDPSCLPSYLPGNSEADLRNVMPTGAWSSYINWFLISRKCPTDMHM